MAQLSLLPVPRPALPRRSPSLRPAAGGTPPATDALQAVGQAIGRDHARHGVLPPPEHLFAGHPVREGWDAGRRAPRPALPAGPAVRRWLALRLTAWQQGIPFEDLLLTPSALDRLWTTCCPVTREPLVADGPQAGVILRLQPRAGYAPGHLVAVAARVARARGERDWTQVLAQADAADARPDGLLDGLTAAEWRRLGSLMSLCAPLTARQAAQVPMHALPPNRVRLLNTVQALQAWVLLQFEPDGWSRRINALADSLPAASRRALHLFVGALLPRVWVPAGSAADRPLTQRLEDAWADERVQRRWQRFADSLDDAQAEALLDQALRLGLSGRRVQRHGAEQAVDGWALDSAPARLS